MSLSPRTTDQAFAFARAQHASGTLRWARRCQEFVHDAYGVGPLFGSAYAQWLGAHPADRHPGGNPADAPLGSLLCTKGVSPYGHIYIAARDFRNGSPGAWSNDLVVTGRIDKVNRNAPMTHWGHRYLGYITSVNGVDLRMPQNRQYTGIHAAIDRLGAALDTAKAQSDAEDVKVLSDEIANLQRLYDTLRRHA